MSEELTPTPASEVELPGEPMGAVETWMKAVTSPSEETYLKIVSDPGLSAGKAYGWIALGGAIGAVFSIIGQALGISPLGDVPSSPISTFFFSVIVSVIAITILTGLTHGIAKMLGGTGTFSKLLYAVAAYGFPLGVVTNALSVIPIVNLLAIPLGFYGIVLNVIAVKASHELTWGKAAVASLSILVGIIFLVACLVFFALAVLGPAIGGIFENILNEIQ